MTSSKLSSEIRRRQVVNATLKIISERGVGNLTTAAIAHEVGMSEANLYRHFASKEEILLETVKIIGSGLEQNVEKVFQSSGTPLEHLRNIFALHLTFIEKNEGIPRLIFSEEIHGGNSHLKTIILNTITTYSGKLESLIKEGQAAGVLKKDISGISTSLTIIGMLQVTILRWSLSGFSFSLTEEGLKLWRNFEQCIKTKIKEKNMHQKKRRGTLAQEVEQ